MLVTEIKHESHHHLLKLRRPSVPYICSGCDEIGYDTCYECRACNFHIHRDCALPSSPLFHRCFKRCDFEFRHDPPYRRICDACRKDINGCFYQCTCQDHDAKGLHPSCAKLPDTLKGEEVTLKLSNKKIPSGCLKCGSRSNSSKGAKGWAYVSSCEKYCLHIACVKEMVYKAWEDGYFDGINPNGASCEDDDAGYNNSGLQLAVPSSSNAVVESSSKRGKIAERFRRVISIITLIISSIFGDPITTCAALIIAVARSLS